MSELKPYGFRLVKPLIGSTVYHKTFTNNSDIPFLLESINIFADIAGALVVEFSVGNEGNRFVFVKATASVGSAGVKNEPNILIYEDDSLFARLITGSGTAPISIVAYGRFIEPSRP